MGPDTRVAGSSADAMKTSIKFSGRLKVVSTTTHRYLSKRTEFRPQSGVCLSTRTAVLTLTAAQAERPSEPHTKGSGQRKCGQPYGKTSCGLKSITASKINRTPQNEPPLLSLLQAITKTGKPTATEEWWVRLWEMGQGRGIGVQ